MSKNKTDGRGRPRKELVYPAGKFTVNTLVPLNPHIKCRLSLYTRCKELVEKNILRYTGKRVHPGTVGKPLDEFQTMASYRISRTLKRNAKLRKLASVPAVDISSAPVSVNV